MIHDFKESPELEPDMSFGEVIRKRRRAMGMNQGDFAHIMGLDQHTISDYETERTSPSIFIAMEILRRIGCEIVIREVKNAN